MAIVLFLAVVLTSCQAFHISLPDIECEYSSSSLEKGNVIKLILNIDRAKCIAKCFLSSSSCSHVAHFSRAQECYLLSSKGSEVLDQRYKEHNAVFGDISCEAVGAPRGNKNRKRSAEPTILSRYKLDGVCCGEKGHKEFTGTKIPTGHLEGFSLELCFASCMEKGCQYILYEPGNKTCKLFLVDQQVDCEGSKLMHWFKSQDYGFSSEVNVYCNVVCHRGSSLPPDICMDKTTTEKPNITETTASSSQPTSQPKPCDQSCVDPCNLKVETEDGRNLTTTVCGHGKCTSKYTGNNQYTFKCDCFSPTDIPPFCTPACATTTGATTTTTPQMTTSTTSKTPTTTGTHEEGVLLIGGRLDKSVPLSSIEFYSFSSHNSSEFGVELPQARYEHVGGLVATDTILIAGGRLGPYKPIATSLYIDLENKTTKPGPNLNTARARAGSAFQFGTDPVFHNGFVCGGFDDQDKTLKSCEKYEGGAFHPFEDMLVDRKELAFAYNRFDGGDPYLLAMGGTNQDNEILKSVERVEVVPLSNGRYKWHKVSPMNYARYGFAADILDGHTYVAGGLELYAERYDAFNDKWHVIGPMMGDRRTGLSFVAVSGTLYALAGQRPVNPRSVETYDLNSNASAWKIEYGVLLTERRYGVGLHVGLNI